MTKTWIYFFSLCILLFSCNNPQTTKDERAQNNASNDKAAIAPLNEALKKYEEASQIIKVAADKPGVITGRKGTKIFINPDDLITENGQPLGKNIEVELKELINQGQLLRTNAQTVSDGKLLVSGGAYYIGMTSNGTPLKLKDGKKLKVQFPKLSKKEMALFYGQRNDLGQINWKKTTETFKATPQSSIPTTDSPITAEKKNKSDLEAIMDYVDSGDTTTTMEERIAIAKRKKEYMAIQKVYDEIGIAQLGWINCDRFLEVEDKTDIYVNFDPKDSVKNANVYLVFKDINSVIQHYYYSEQSIQFEDMPVGYKVRLIAYTIKQEKVFAYSTDLTITKGQKITLNLKEIKEKDFKQLMNN